MTSDNYFFRLHDRTQQISAIANRAERLAALAIRLCHGTAAQIVRFDQHSFAVLGSTADSLLDDVYISMIRDWNQLLGNDQLAVVADTAAVPAFASHPGVLSNPAIRFVARRVISDTGSYPQIALWLWDTAPRSLTNDEIAALDELVALADSIAADATATPVAAAMPAEDIARSAAARLHAILRNATDLVSINGWQGDIQYISPSVTRILGYYPDDLIGKSSFDLLHPDDLPQIAESFSAIRHVAGTNHGAKMRVRAKNGEWRVLEATFTNLLHDPQIRGVVVNARDITDRAQAEAAQRASEARFQAIFASAPVGIIATDQHGQMVLVNPLVGELFGYEPAHLIGQSIEYLLPDDRPATQHGQREPYVESLRAHPPGVGMNLVGRHQDGTRIPVKVYLSVLQPADEFQMVIFVSDVRARQQIEEALRESEDRYRSLIELAPDAVLVVRDQQIRFINRTGVTILGAAQPENLIGRLITDFVVPDDLPLAISRLEAGINGRNVHQVAYRVTTLDGTLRQVEATSTNISYGGAPAVLVIARDVTERCAHDQLMRFQASVLAQLNEAVVATDPTGQITYINQAAERYYGQSLAEVQGTMLPDLYTVEYLQHDDEPAARAALEANGVWRGENRHVTRDGRTLVVDTAVVMLRADDGTPIGMFGVSRDITARKQIDERLQLLESVVVHTNDSVMITSAAELQLPGPQILYVNAAFTRSTGYTAEEVLGKTPRILQGSGTDPKTVAQIRAALAHWEPIQVEVLNYTKTGQELWLNLSITPVFDDTGTATHFIAIQRDVTERKRLEAQLLQSQKLESIGRLTGGIAHDFNNLLTGISGYADLALSDAPEVSALRDDLVELRHEIDRAADLTRQLMLFARRQPAQQQQVGLNSVITTLEKLLRHLLGTDISLLIELDSQIPPILLDLSQLEQVIVNLVVNARDAMPDGGSLTIQTSMAPAATASMFRPQPPTQTYVRLRVADTGCGMTAEVQRHAFEPFFTTKAIGYGTGLGLSTVYGIIQQHGGTIAIESQPGTGTAIVIDFPLLEGTVEAPLAKQRAPLPQPGTETLLVVDDESAIREVAARMLRKAGYTVYTAANGQDAIQFLQTNPAAAIQLVVTDVVMPELNGRRLGTFLAATYPAISVLYISGNPTLNQAPDDSTPLEPMLLKPFTQDELLHAVRNQLQRAS